MTYRRLHVNLELTFIERPFLFRHVYTHAYTAYTKTILGSSSTQTQHANDRCTAMNFPTCFILALIVISQHTLHDVKGTTENDSADDRVISYRFVVTSTVREIFGQTRQEISEQFKVLTTPIINVFARAGIKLRIQDVVFLSETLSHSSMKVVQKHFDDNKPTFGRHGVDCTHYLIGTEPQGATQGTALIRELTRYRYCIGFSIMYGEKHGEYPELSTILHEMGHNIGLSHECDHGCGIMSAANAFIPEEGFSVNSSDFIKKLYYESQTKLCHINYYLPQYCALRTEMMIGKCFARLSDNRKQNIVSIVGPICAFTLSMLALAAILIFLTRSDLCSKAALIAKFRTTVSNRQPAESASSGIDAARLKRSIVHSNPSMRTPEDHTSVTVQPISPTQSVEIDRPRCTSSSAGGARPTNVQNGGINRLVTSLTSRNTTTPAPSSVALKTSADSGAKKKTVRATPIEQTHYSVKDIKNRFQKC